MTETKPLPLTVGILSAALSPVNDIIWSGILALPAIMFTAVVKA